MKKIILFIVVPAALLFGTPAVEGQDMDMDMYDFIIGGIVMRREMLIGVHITFDYEVHTVWTYPDKKSFVSNYSYDVYRYDDMIKFTLNKKSTYDDEVLRSRATFTWNGDLSYEGWMDAERPNSDYYKSGIIYTDKSPHFDLGLWPTPVEMEVFELHKTLPELLEMGRWRISGPVQIGAYDNVYKLEGRQLYSPEHTDVLEVWISPLHDFVPVQMRHTQNGKTSYHNFEATYTMDRVRLEQINGVWVIAEAVCTFDTNESRRKAVATGYFRLRRHELIGELKRSFFELFYPEGTPVYDYRLGTTYIVNQGIYVSDDTGRHFVKYEDLDKDTDVKDNFESGAEGTVDETYRPPAVDDSPTKTGADRNVTDVSGTSSGLKKSLDILTVVLAAVIYMSYVGYMLVLRRRKNRGVR